MVHVIASLGVFFAFLITSTAWVMAKVGGVVLAALAFVVTVILAAQRARRRAKLRRKQ